MKLSAPTTVVWWISLILGAIGLLLYTNLIKIAALSPYAFWLVFVALVLMLLATYLKRM